MTLGIYKKKLYYGFWALALILCILIFSRYRLTNHCVGLVESKVHTLGAQEPGVVKNLLVQVGDSVKQGQVLATLDMTDLDNALTLLQNELSTFNHLQSLQKEYLSLDFQRMGLQIENEASELSERLSLIESKMTELAVLNREIERLQNAEKAGLGYSRDLAALILQREALNTYLREQAKNLQYQNQKLSKSRKTLEALQSVQNDSMARVLLLEPLQRVEDIKREMNTIEYRIGARTLTAPCDGHVTALLAFPGDMVDAFIPILTIEESRPRYATLYLSERSNFNVETGMLAKIHSNRLDEYRTTGVIEFVHPGFSRSSERLSFNGQPFWARMLHVKLPENHKFLPGEFVYANLSKKKRTLQKRNQSEQNTRADIQTLKNTVMEMIVPEAIYRQHRFEPSGCAWLEAEQKYIIISDDTGFKDQANDKTPVLFLMDEKGVVNENPVPILGVKTINDLEAITPIDENRYYLISSQSLSKKGNRPKNREQLLDVTYKKGRFEVNGQISLLSEILKSCSSEKMQALGLMPSIPRSQMILNIEAAAYQNGSLLLGLKEPISDQGAIIWELKNPQDLLKTQKLQPNQLILYGTVVLKKYKGRPAGFSDLFQDETGILWAASTIPDVEDKDQMGAVLRIIKADNKTLRADHLLEFEGLKPEGLCIREKKDIMIVFDRNTQIPKYFFAPLEEL